MNDGQARIEQGEHKDEGINQRGTYQFIGENGQKFKVDYTADATGGFLAEGDHIHKEVVEHVPEVQF